MVLEIVQLSLEQRIERLEHVVTKLAFEASAGQGSLGKPFWDFIDVMNAERVARESREATK
jgi:hypothetical protein